MNHQLSFYEFFAGGGMVRAGLGAGWRCAFANDFSRMKASAYSANWGKGELVCADVATVRASDVPGVADLAWASFPCQDLSLAGNGKGLGEAASGTKTKSGAFWPFWQLMCELVAQDRAPQMIVLENVPGVLTSHGGRDFANLCAAISQAGYNFGALVIDANLFVPQSRRRVFFVAIRRGTPAAKIVISPEPQPFWHPAAMVSAYHGLAANIKPHWMWWNLPMPPARKATLADLIEADSEDLHWHGSSETSYLLSLMSPGNLAKVAKAALTGHQNIGCIYRRTRPDAKGIRHQRAEVRFDDRAGCLRTPGGGSSRQTILIVEGKCIRSRLLSSREAARLMGLDDSYLLPERYNDAYHLAGDGVCVPVVRFLAEQLLEPALAAAPAARRLIAAE